jgi:WD40 repeat protein
MSCPVHQCDADRCLTRFVIGGRKGLVRCWDPEGNRVAFDMEGAHTKSVNIVIAYRSSASGTTRLLTVCSADATAKVWETAGDSGALVLTLEDAFRDDEQDHEHRIKSACVFYGPTGSDRMATGYLSGHIRVWDGEAVRTIRVDDPAQAHMLTEYV